MDLPQTATNKNFSKPKSDAFATKRECIYECMHHYIPKDHTSEINLYGDLWKHFTCAQFNNDISKIRWKPKMSPKVFTTEVNIGICIQCELVLILINTVYLVYFQISFFYSIAQENKISTTD